MTRYEKVAKRAIEVYLADKTEPVTLFSVSCVADEAAGDAGKVQELYGSLFSYEDLLPSEWRPRWLSAEGCSDSLLYAVPMTWKPGTPAKSLLLGDGALRPTQRTYADMMYM